MNEPILILGAGRSGTKMLRGILGAHPQIATFPREINYIWRHGNAGFPTDELGSEHARPDVIRYIRKKFESLSARNSGKRVVEKTCANSLRVDFVHAVFPEAYFIHLIRDGRAVAESAMRRWQARPDPRYLLQKARWVPFLDAPHYGLRFVRYQLARLGSPGGAQASWGPRFAGLDELVASKMLVEVCGLQWKACTKAADSALKQLPQNQTVTVRYEDFVTNPISETRRIFDQVNLSFVHECRDHIERSVSQAHLNKWQVKLSEQDLALLLPHIESELLRLGYQV